MFHKVQSWAHYSIFSIPMNYRVLRKPIWSCMLMTPPSFFAEDDRDLLLWRVDSSVESLNEYFIANDLLMIVGETQTLLFSNRSNDNLTINYERNSFVWTENILFLGVNVDRRLDWGCHTDNLETGMAKYCYCSENISEAVALSGYFAYIHTKISYWIIFWGNSSDVNRVLVLQKRCLIVNSIFFLQNVTKLI